MGMFATIKGLSQCPKCGEKAEWQSKGLWLNYKDMTIWIGDSHGIKLDKNMNGHIVCYCWGKEHGFLGCNNCGEISYYKIIKGKLVKSTEEDYQK